MSSPESPQTASSASSTSTNASDAPSTSTSNTNTNTAGDSSDPEATEHHGAPPASFVIGLLLFAIGMGLAQTTSIRHDGAWRFLTLSLGPMEDSLWGLGMLFLVADPLVLVHELGHWFAARMVDFRVVEMIAGPIRCQVSESGSLKLSFNRDRRFFLAGQVRARPRSGKRLLPKAICMLAAGPATHPLIALLAGGLYWAGWPWQPRVLGAPLFTIALYSATRTFLGLLPVSHPRTALASDARQILGLLRREPSFVVPWLRACVMDNVFAHRRPREWGLLAKEWLDITESEIADGRGVLFLLILALDQNDFESARTLLARGLERRTRFEPPVQHDLLVQAAAFHALFDNDLARAQSEYDAISSITQITSYRMIAQAALLLARGDREASKQTLDGWLRSLEAIPQGALYRLGNEWIIDRLTGVNANANASEVAQGSGQPSPLP